MPEDNADIIRKAVEHFNRTGEAALQYYAPDVVFAGRPDLGDSLTVHGHDGLQRAFASFRNVWAGGIHLDVSEVIGSGDAHVVVLRVHVRGGKSGVELRFQEGWAVWLHGGKLTRIEQYGTKDEALEAAGLSA
jgi:ketosteroid isomerase-like protein